MNYIYDILLNVSNNEKIYDFFEWNLEDEIINVKKAPIIKVNSKILSDIINYKVKFNKVFLQKIENNFLIYKNIKKKIKYLVVLSDCKKSIGITINEQGITESKCGMLIDEEEECLLILSKEKNENIEYTKIKKENNNSYLTRKEIEYKKILLKEINNLYKNNNIEKLKYLYIEYFNEKEENIENIYNNLLKSLNIIDSKHEYLINLLNLNKTKYPKFEKNPKI